MNKPKIAVLIDWYLPGTKAGGPVRSVHSLITLLKDRYDFYILTTDCDLGSNVPYEGIQSDRLFVKENLNFCYFSKKALSSGNIYTILKEINPDLIYLNSLWSWHFSINIVRLKSKNKIKAPVLLATRGMLGKGAMGLKPFKKKLFLQVAKLMGWYKKVCFHATKDQEREDILKAFADAQIKLAPNINSSKAAENKSIKVRNELDVFFLSRITEVKNLSFALNQLFNVPAGYRIKFDIYGNPEDQGYFEYCKDLATDMPENIRVNFKGEIQFDKIQDSLVKYHCLFLPSLNENFGHSIVESLYCGCLAVISDQTPWNDIEQAGAGFALPLDEPEKFTKAIIAIAELDQQEFSLKSKAAINYIREKINTETIFARYEQLFNEQLKNRPV